MFVKNDQASGLTERAKEEKTKTGQEKPEQDGEQSPAQKVPDFDHEGDDPRGFIPDNI